MFSPTELVFEYIKRINTHKVDLITQLMSPDHVFIDERDTQVSGREAMRAGWASYLESFPDYKITANDMIQQGHIIALFGRMSGTFVVNGDLLPENHWDIPAAWKVITGGGFITQWHIYADTQRVREIMTANT